MDSKFQNKCIDFLLRYRNLLALLSIIFTIVFAFPAKDLYFESDYKIYFELDDPHLVAHEDMQEEYTKSDNIAIIVQPADRDIFSERNLSLIHELTEASWQTPFVIRVDSITNYQHTSADGEDLLVEAFVSDPADLSRERIDYIKKAALDQKSLVNRLISKDAATAMINVALELPANIDPDADIETQNQQRIARDGAYPQVVKFHRDIVQEYQSKYPDLEIHLGGISVITNTFNESTIRDMSSLIPLMYALIILTLALFLRSLGSMVGAFLVIAFSSIFGIASAGWLGYAINTVSIIAPTIILTIAVCDSVHLLVSYLRSLGAQMPPVEAMRESMRLNFQPVILTSVTTAVGFLTLNFSISPPFQEFGNMTAAGVLWAMVLTFTLLPAITMLLVRKRKLQTKETNLIDRYAQFVVNNQKSVFISAILAAAALICFIPLNVIDDDPISYFKPGVPFRDASDFMIENLPGVKDVNFSVSCGDAGCINDSAFLKKMDQFETWLSKQPKVVYVSSYTDVIKRLNRSMNNDAQDYYRIPDDSELAAQYNLLYEMSLPYGLDLNNQVNIDKSAIRIAVLAEQMTTDEFISLEESGRSWLREKQASDISPGASVSLMFAHMGVKNIKSMLLGGVFAIIGVTLTILIALRSFRYALISMIPNSFPALMAFGVWGLTIGQINMAVAGVFSISLGILVDDTVHFISKYRDGRLVKKFSPEESIIYAFSKVGSALIVTTIILVLGFSLLTMSDFNLNSMMGTLTAITIAIALIFDFMILPPLLIMFDRDSKIEA